jgi:hypothetical protein
LRVALPPTGRRRFSDELDNKRIAVREPRNDLELAAHRHDVTAQRRKQDIAALLEA